MKRWSGELTTLFKFEKNGMIYRFTIARFLSQLGSRLICQHELLCNFCLCLFYSSGRDKVMIIWNLAKRSQIKTVPVYEVCNSLIFQKKKITHTQQWSDIISHFSKVKRLRFKFLMNFNFFFIVCWEYAFIEERSNYWKS